MYLEFFYQKLSRDAWKLSSVSSEFSEKLFLEEITIGGFENRGLKIERSRLLERPGIEISSEKQRTARTYERTFQSLLVLNIFNFIPRV